MDGEYMETEAKYLFLRVGRMLCGVPIDSVVETMRPLPTENLPDTPDLIAGYAVIRGRPTPVLELARLLDSDDSDDSDDSAQATRFVTVRAGDREFALSVEGVAGVRTLSTAAADAALPLLGETSKDGEISKELARKVSVVDDRLLLLLETARLVPAEAWEPLERLMESAT